MIVGEKLCCLIGAVKDPLLMKRFDPEHVGYSTSSVQKLISVQRNVKKLNDSIRGGDNTVLTAESRSRSTPAGNSLMGFHGDRMESRGNCET